MISGHPSFCIIIRIKVALSILPGLFGVLIFKCSQSFLFLLIVLFLVVIVLVSNCFL